MTVIVMDDGTFESHKLVDRCPMTRGQWCAYRGWNLPADEEGSDLGYLVEYLDGGKPNDKRHLGYISWSPKAQFDNGYTKVVERNKVEFSAIQKMVASLRYEFERVGKTTVTGCWAFLPSGFNVGYGESACVDPANFDFELGKKYALERCRVNATNELWKLEGYLLAITLAKISI